MAKDAWPFIALLGGITAAFWYAGCASSSGVLYVFSAIFFMLTLFVCFFFRDPERKVTKGDDIAISPADGRVQFLEDIAHDDFIGGPAKKISIFLSVFNVHINRSPIEGKVAYKAYRPGKMLPAFKSHASEENERATIGVEGPAGRVLVHQITGFIARRIVCRPEVGTPLAQGERYGLIKFGSCTELIIPASAEVLVNIGDKVVGGQTVLAKLKK
ncbi:phosphatidylserine decarboxylase family protein [bacterium]|nr:MAG: phosphatidylserine decarboxylase family protein [bacterium]